MANDEVRPALTAEEWVTFEHRMRSCVVWVDADGHLGISSKLGKVWIEDRHAVAALALYGHTFGFTREDVAALTAEAHPGSDAYHPGAPCCDPEARQRTLSRLAAKIVALWPPGTV